jgi:hypothetical protein
MRRIHWLSILFCSVLSTCLASTGLVGCLGLAGNFDLISDAGDATLADVVVPEDARDATRDTKGETGPAEAETDGPTCTPGGTCDAGQCSIGQWVCSENGLTC